MRLFGNKTNNAPKKENKEFVDYANAAKLREFNSYLKNVSKYFNNPICELLRQRGMLLEVLYVRDLSSIKKQEIRLEIEKIDKMINKLSK